MQDQENLSNNSPRPQQLCALPLAPGPGGACGGAFSFQPPRGRIDWRALHRLDVDRLVRTADIDALERVLDVVAYGDIEAEDTRNLTPLNFIRLFRVAQLTVEYLLFVQDRLAADNCVLKGEVGKLQGHVDVLQLKVKEQREELAAGRKELRQIKRAMRTLEVLALAQKQAPQVQPAPAPQVVERVVEVPDPVAQYKLERLEAELGEAAREREAMQRELVSLKDALAAAGSGRAGTGEATIAAAVEAVRRQEQDIAEQRIQAAVDQERRTHLRDSSKIKLRVVADSDECRTLRTKLAESLQRQRELEKQKGVLETELVHALASPHRVGASPGAQVRRLQAELEAAQEEIRALQAKPQQARPCSRSSPRRRSANLQASGVGSLLESASEASDVRVEQLQAEVSALKADLDAARSEKAELQQAQQRLQRELQDARQQLDQLQQRGPNDAGWQAAEMRRLDAEVAKLRDRNRELHRENAELRRAAGRASPAPASPVTAARPAPLEVEATGHSLPTLIRAQHVSSQQDGRRVVEAAASARAGMGSPIEELADGEAEAVHNPSSPARQARQQQSPRPSPSVAAAHREGRPQCSRSPTSPHSAVAGWAAAGNGEAAWQRRFDAEMRYTLGGHARPGVVSRFPHSLGPMLEMRRELLGELGTEVDRELATYGISPGAQGISDGQFAAAMEELKARRAEARVQLGAQDRERMDYMRATITAHVDRVARSVASDRSHTSARSRSASPTRSPGRAAAEPLRPPQSLKPIRTRSDSRERSLSPASRRRDDVELAAGVDGADPETAAFYSPLRSGASQMSFSSRKGSPLSPSSLRPAGPLVQDESGTLRSPWAITHDRVFNTLDVGDAESPLAHGARRSQLLQPGPLTRSPGIHRSPRSPNARPYNSGGAASPSAWDRSPSHSPSRLQGSGGRGSPGATPQVQRLPRRVARSGAAADGEAGREPASLAWHSSERGGGNSPTQRRVQHGAAGRYPPDADADSPMAASPSRQRHGGGSARVWRSGGGLRDSHGSLADDAEEVQLVLSRADPLRGSMRAKLD